MPHALSHGYQVVSLIIVITVSIAVIVPTYALSCDYWNAPLCPGLPSSQPHLILFLWFPLQIFWSCLGMSNNRTQLILEETVYVFIRNPGINYLWFGHLKVEALWASQGGRWMFWVLITVFLLACSLDVKTCNEVDLENSVDWEVKTITSALKQYLR